MVAVASNNYVKTAVNIEHSPRSMVRINHLTLTNIEREGAPVLASRP